MSTFDAEAIMLKVESMICGIFNDAVAAVNAEKNDGFSVLGVEPAGLQMQSLDDSAKGYYPFLFVRLDDLKTTTEGRAVAKTYFLEVALIFNTLNDGNESKRMYRYLRVIEETGKSLWDKIGRGYSEAIITTLTPIAFKFNEQSDPDKVVGVRLEFSIS